MNRSEAFPVRFSRAIPMAAALLLMPTLVLAAPARDVLPSLEKRRARVRNLHHKTETTIKDEKGSVIRTLVLETWEHRDGDTRRFKTVSRSHTPKSGGDDADKKKATESVTVSDGKHVWREVRRGDTLMVVKSGGDPAPNELESLSRASRALVMGEERVDGHPCIVIESRTKHGGESGSAKYWVSESYGIILRSKVKQRDGSTSVTTTKHLEINEPLSSVKFTYSPPEGATVVDMAQFERDND